MKLLKLQVLSGPNLWSNYRRNLIQARLDLEEMEDCPTDRIPGFSDRLKSLLPGLVEHECSEGMRGGFFRRLERGTWLGHVIEHVALELQTMAGMNAGYGRTRGTRERGVYNLVFTYEVEQAGLFAAEASFRLVDALSRNLPYDLGPDLLELRKIKKRYGLGPSTKSIVQEAERRGIPWKRLADDSGIQLGYGKNQVRFQATITGRTSALAVDLAGDKDDTKRLLAAAHIPVPEGDYCLDADGLMAIIGEIGFPVVIKPLDGNQGKGASINVQSVAEAKTAFLQAQEFCKYVMVEKYIAGSDYRLLVVGGKFTAASKRVPAHVTGDGISTIRELIAMVNSDPRRGDGHESELTKIVFDKDTFTQLEKAGYTIESIPPADEMVFLKSTANLSTGGTAIDATDEVCAENRVLAERVAAAVGLDICGIDIMAKSICRPLRETGGAVLEVNAAPGFRMHLSPSEGKPRDVAAAVLDMLYPPGAASRIPIMAVTGTNGKTTTTRLLAHMVKKAGYNVGYTTTDGIYVGDCKICDGDTTGPVSAGAILRDATVDYAVLETARGGMLRSGLYFDACDVGVITNIREDHLGLNDIHTLDDLAKVKSIIARAVKETGWAVLNADDKHCVAIAGELDCNVALFALDEKLDSIQNHVSRGGCAAVLDGNEIFILEGPQKTFVANLANVPLAENGRAMFMVENVLAACVAAYTGGIGLDAIRQALQTFVPGYELTPGRMNLFDMGDYKVLVDYAHNPHGLKAIRDYLAGVGAVRKIGVISGIGDRRDEDITEFAEIAAGMFDHIVVRQEHSLRGRTEEEINALVAKGIGKVRNDIPVDFVPDEADAARHALSIAAKGDFVVALSDQYGQVIAVIKEALHKDRPVTKLETHYEKSIAS